MFLKIATQAFEARDFFNIFLRFWGFWGSFSYKKFSYKKRRVVYVEVKSTGEHEKKEYETSSQQLKLALEQGLRNLRKLQQCDNEGKSSSDEQKS